MISYLIPCGSLFCLFEPILVNFTEKAGMMKYGNELFFDGIFGGSWFYHYS